MITAPTRSSTGSVILPLVKTVSLTLLGAPEDVDLQARRLRNELLGLDLESVEIAPSSQPVPPSAKGLDPAVVTTIVATAASSPVLIQLGRVLRDWVNRNSRGRIVVKDGDRILEISNANADDTKAVIDAFFSEEDEHR